MSISFRVLNWLRHNHGENVLVGHIKLQYCTHYARVDTSVGFSLSAWDLCLLILIPLIYTLQLLTQSECSSPQLSVLCTLNRFPSDLSATAKSYELLSYILT